MRRDDRLYGSTTAAVLARMTVPSIARFTS
jgi:hypothetical protein